MERNNVMVKHSILWKLKECLPPDEKVSVKRNIKENLGSLAGKVHGLMDITVRTDSMASFNADVMLGCTLENKTDLAGYQTHPEHIRVGG